MKANFDNIKIYLLVFAITVIVVLLVSNIIVASTNAKLLIGSIIIFVFIFLLSRKILKNKRKE